MDGVMQYFLMAFGAVFSVAGLVLIFRKAKPDAGAAKIEFLGQKLEANSTGIVVFLIGAAFLAAPLFVPAKNLQKAAPSTPAASETAGAASTPIKPAPAGGNAGAAEVEDNNSFTKANSFANGATTGGYVKMEDEDWFVVDVGNGVAKELNIAFKNLGQGCMDVRAYDEAESELDYAFNCGNDVTKKTFSVPQGKIHLRVHGRGAWGNYVLTAASD